MSEHSPIGGSTIGPIMKCHGRLAMAAACPPVPESIHAREGTRAHALADWCLKAGETTADGYIGAEFNELPGDKFIVDRGMAEAVNVYLAHVWDIFGASKPAAIYGEQRFFVPEIDPIASGTSDCAVFHPAEEHLHVFDYKHGVGVVVEVKGNAQARFYGGGAVRKFRADGHRVRNVTFHIVQPRAFHPDGAVRSETIDVFELGDWLADAAEAVAEAKKPGAARTPGEYQCQFCPGTRINPEIGRAYCKEWEESALNAARAIDGDVIRPEDVPNLIGSSLWSKEPAEVEIGRRLDMLPLLRKFIEAFEDFAEAEARAGRMPKGYKWVAGNGSRSWKLSDAETARAIERKTNAVNPWMAPKLRSPAQIEDALGKKLAQTVLDGLVEKTPGAPKLAPLSSPKKEITPTFSTPNLLPKISTLDAL